jgi:hypothetical protein
VAVLDGAELALRVGRDGVLASVAEEVGALGILGGARKAGRVGVKFAVLYGV